MTATRNSVFKTLQGETLAIQCDDKLHSSSGNANTVWNFPVREWYTRGRPGRNSPFNGGHAFGHATKVDSACKLERGLLEGVEI